MTVSGSGGVRGDQPGSAEEMSVDPDRCYVTEVDGQAIRIQGQQPTTPEDRVALAEVIRAAKRYMATLPPAPISFACPDCAQPAGAFCRNASGRVSAVHSSRRALAGESS